MSLLSQLPPIDDRTYDDIVSEIRARIPSYTPEWAPTRWDDFNESDPGIVFSELFAWLTEMLLYRLGNVPEQNYIRFLELLGIELRPAQPARTELTFPVKDVHPDPFVIVPLRTQIETAEKDPEGKPIIFETDTALTAIKATMIGVTPRQDELQPLENLLAANEAADVGFSPFGANVRPDSALYLGFNEELPQVQIDLMAWVTEAETGIAALKCDPGIPVFPSARLTWEFQSSAGWIPLNVLNDDTAAFERSGHIIFDGPPPGAMIDVSLGSVTAYWIRAKVLDTQYQRAPRLLSIRTNTVASTQVETIVDEVLGATDGSPGQTFTIQNTPVLKESLKIEIDEGLPEKMWEPRDDLLGSGPRDRHFALDPAAGEIAFGDGRRHGRIPVANPDQPTGNVIAREYRFGGGTQGNVVAGGINSLMTSIPGIDSEGVRNVFASHSGRDEQSLDEAKEQAARSVKSKDRAVTAEDFESLAEQVGQIRRAKALPLHHPDFPDRGVPGEVTRIPGVVTVIVVPDGTSPAPTPSAGMMRSVCEYLDERRLLTTELFVAKPVYTLIEVKGTAIAAPREDLARLTRAAQDALSDYFHPLNGGEDGRGWPFGGDIFYSRVYQRVLIPGVDRIDALEIWVDGEKQEDCTNVTIPAGVLTYSAGHSELRVDYDRRPSS